MDDSEYKHFIKELRAEPGRVVSRGTGALMQVMALQGRGV